MAQQYSTPGNSANDFYTPQASGTRRSQANPASSYFGTGGQTGYSQSAWSGGNNGNPSGIGAGSSGINAGNGPGSFMQAMNGQGGVPGSGGNFQWGSVTAGMPGTNYSDPATAQQYSDNMMASGDPYAGMYGSSAPTPMNNAGQAAAATAGMAGGTPGYDPSGGLGLQQGSSPFTWAPGSGSGGIYVNGQYVPVNYVNARGMERLNWEAIFNAGGLEAAAQQEQQRLQAEAQARQAAQHQAFLDANPGWVSPEQLAANMQANSGMRAAEDALLAQYPGGIPNDIHQQMLSQFGMQAGGNTGQSQLGAAMQSGMPTQAIGQQMGAPGAVDPYSTALPESFAQGGYQPGDTSIPTGNIGGAPPNAVSPERFGRLPVNELQRIASGQGSQLRPELQQQAAMMASNELARRGAGGNNLAAGNQQAQDPRAVEQSSGFQQAERIRRLQNMGVDTRGVTPLDAMRGNVPATQEQMAEQQRLQQAGIARQNQRMGLDLPELEERLRGNNVPEDNTQPQRQPQSGYGQFAQGFQQGLGWMDPTRLFGGGNDLVRNGQGGLTMAPGGGIDQSLNAMRGDGPFAPDMLDVTTPENIFQAVINQRSGGGGYVVPGFEQGRDMSRLGGDIGPIADTTIGGAGIPDSGPALNELMRPQQQPGGVAQNPYEKMPGYVQPYQPQQQTPSTGNPIWGSQPQSSSNPYPGTIQTIPFGQGLPPGISGSMAIGPDGKPYGGTPNLSRPEPQQPTGYGNDVVQRPQPQGQQQQPQQQPTNDSGGVIPTYQSRVDELIGAIRNAQSPEEETALVQQLNQLRNAGTVSGQLASRANQNYVNRGVANLPYNADSMLAMLLGNPQFN